MVCLSNSVFSSPSRSTAEKSLGQHSCKVTQKLVLGGVMSLLVGGETHLVSTLCIMWAWVEKR